MRFAGYIFSLPERLSRILVGSTAGLVKGIVEFLLPEAVRKTRLYQVILNKNLRYMIGEIGAVKGVYPETAPVSNYLARKFVGNFVDLACILTLHASPVWILALVSDISGGTRLFLDELTADLKKQGLLDPGNRAETIDQLLDGLQSFAGEVSNQIDTPPLSLEELRQSLNYLRQEAKAFHLANSKTDKEMDLIAREIKGIAEKEQKSFLEISTALAINAVNQLQRSTRAAATGIRVGHALIDRSIFQYYRHALEGISRKGYYRYLARSSKPYLKAIGRNLAWNNVTWTEKYFLNWVSRHITA